MQTYSVITEQRHRNAAAQVTGVTVTLTTQSAPGRVLVLRSSPLPNQEH